MSNQLAKFGAQPSKPVRYGVLWSNRFATGLWTQRSPLRDAASTRIEEEFYGARGDALIDGLNCEVSPKLTFIRRPGCSVYNSNTLPAIKRFYSFRTVVNGIEQIQVIANVFPVSSPFAHPTIRNVTGPSTLETLAFEEGFIPNTTFQSVGNTLYFSSSNGSSGKWVLSTLAWQANTAFSQGQFIVDTNNNLQLSIGSQTATVTNVQIQSNVCTLFFSTSTPLDIPIGTELSLSGQTTVTALSGTTQTVSAVANSFQVSFPFTHGNVAFSVETGTATTGTGVTGGTQPTWATSDGQITQDGTLQWECLGSSVQNWGIVAPTQTPVVTQTPAPSVYPAWAANTWYAPLFVIIDSNGNLQQLTATTTSTSPPTWQTGTSHPTWATIKGNTTSDNNGSPSNPALWTCLGNPAWQASHAYNVGDVVAATFTYYITVPQEEYQIINGVPVKVIVYVPEPTTATGIFQVTVAGTSGGTTPYWLNGVGTTTNDGTVTWLNQGSSLANVWPGASQTLSLATQILDSNQNIETVQNFGESAGTAPTWNVNTPPKSSVGLFTTDNTLIWLNTGSFGQANTGAWIYAYSYVNTITGAISTASPLSAPITPQKGNLPVIQGVGSGDPQVDEIYLWRTVQGGSQLFYLDQIPNPGAGLSWIYTDTTPDTGLNNLIEAPVDSTNNPPPTGLTNLTYHLGSVWGTVNNLVYYSDGPNVTSGNGNEAWSPSNVFAFPENVYRLLPTSNGLIVFTLSDIYIIQGLNTAISPLISLPFLQNIGLSSYDAFATNGVIVYMYTSDNQIVSLDPNAGVSEIGFPIGDQFGPNYGTETFTPTSTQVAWHIAGSPDKGLYVSDQVSSWWRFSPTPSPESGLTWSPRAQITGGFSAVQSIETSPGTHTLLIGGRGSPILERDYTVYSDNGSAYNAFAVLGSVVLAQPGQLAMVESITTDSVAIGTPITLAVQIDEIAPVSSGLFEALTIYAPDPTELPPSTSVYAQRFYLSQTQDPAVCRHLQIQINWGTDTVKNELLSLSLFGGFEQEK